MSPSDAFSPRTHATARDEPVNRHSPARVTLWDTARFVLIALVVVGHTISTVRTNSDLAYALYAGIYLFHMPAMIALSGVFAKPTVTPKAVRSTLQLLVVWLLWEGIWAVIRWVVNGRDLPETWLVIPAWTLWFLVTLATMRILLPFIAQLRHPLLFSVGVALLAGFSPAIGTEFSASRTLCFLPFFVGAWVAADRGLTARTSFLQPSRTLRGAAWAVLGLTVVASVGLSQLRDSWRIDTWLTWRDSYDWLFRHAPVDDFAPTEWWAIALGGVGVRGLLLIVGATVTVALLLVVPRTPSVLSRWGTRTLFVYLLHGPIVFALRETGAVAAIGEWGSAGVLLLVVIALALTVVLSLEGVAKVCAGIVQPKLSRVFRPDPARP